MPCPIGRAVDALGDRWTLLILRNATVGVTRFEQFKSDLGIADNILSARLTRLIERGLMVKMPYQDVNRTRYEYRLTEAGADILPVLHALAQWGEKHTASDEPARPMEIVHTRCGHTTPSGDRCQHCKRPMPRNEQAWLRPWRSDIPFPLADPVV